MCKCEHPSAVLACLFSPDGERLATAGKGKVLKIWDANIGSEINALACNEEVSAMAWFLDSKTLATGGNGAPASQRESMFS
jgi:WD40 repeat protein